MTALVTLGGVYLNQHFNNKTVEKKHEEDEKEKRLESQKIAYQNFLNVFSKTEPNEGINKIELDDYSGKLLKAALDVIEFGDVILPTPKRVTAKDVTDNVIIDRTIKSLSDIVESLIKVRYNYGLLDHIRLEGFLSIRQLASEEFSPILLKYLMTKEVSG